MSLFPLLTRHPFSGAIRPVTPALLAEVYLAPRPLPFAVQLAGIDAPWSASVEVAPLETQTAVERALRRLMEASPTLRPDADGLDALQGAKPGVAYHLLRDSGVLHHGLTPRQSRMEAIVNDISEHALEQLAERLAEVGAGTIRLNSTADADFFAKTAKLTPPYALQDNPLVVAFLTEPEE